MRTAIRAGLALIITASAGCHATNAEDFPSRPIILVSTYAAGSGNDIIARAVGRGMSEVLKQTVVIENRAGASGTIGLNYVSRSKPDGYTLAMGGIGSVVLHPAFEGTRETFNPQEALAPVALVADGSPVLVVNAALGVKTLPELLALARKQQVTYGSPGVGSSMHFTGELLKEVAGVPLVHVAYRGQGIVMNDVLAGTINFAFLNLPVVIPLLHDSRVRILAIAAKKRAPQLPDVPTTGELGYPKVVMQNWYAIYAPHGTPAPIIEKLTKTIQQGMALPAIQNLITTTTGLVPLAEGPEELAKQTAEDIAKWKPIADGLRK